MVDESVHSVKIECEVSVGDKYQILSPTLLRNIDVYKPSDIFIEIHSCKTMGNYFVSDFVVSFFKAVEQIFSGSKHEGILLSLSPETNYIEKDGDLYVLCLWDYKDRLYKKIHCTGEELIKMAYSLKLEYETYLKNQYDIEGVLEFQLFHLGLYARLI